MLSQNEGQWSEVRHRWMTDEYSNIVCLILGAGHTHHSMQPVCYNATCLQSSTSSASIWVCLKLFCRPRFPT